jgi:hypothetical protein
VVVGEQKAQGPLRSPLVWPGVVSAWRLPARTVISRRKGNGADSLGDDACLVDANFKL